MAADDNSHVWMASVSPAVESLSTRGAKALVLGSSFARRVKATDAEHGARLCGHGRLLFQVCHFCVEGVPPMPDPTFAEQRENAKAWLAGVPR